VQVKASKTSAGGRPVVDAPLRLQLAVGRDCCWPGATTDAGRDDSGSIRRDPQGMNALRTGPIADQTAVVRRRGSADGSSTIPWPAPFAEQLITQLAGRVVAGRYRLRRLLGRGGMGAVWVATDERLRRPVAVKQQVLAGAATHGERLAARARLRSEARLTARVDHPGTVRIYDLAEEAGEPWIVMEALPGRTLEAALHDQGPLPVGQVTGLGLWLLEVLEATHRAGVVHRDVKPSNVQLCGGVRVVLTDFGIAATTQDGPGGFNGRVSGSPAYMAPEQVHGDKVEPASDLFSLGATLYTAVEGRSPFGKGCPVATLTAVVDDPPAPFRRAGPLGPVIEGLLAKDPGRRLDTDQACRALRVIQGGRSTRPVHVDAHRPGGRAGS
jgi:eukaryotic-like serine/threonine-protein kinase